MKSWVAGVTDKNTRWEGGREGSDTWLMDLLHKRPKVCFFLIIIIIIPGAGEGTPSPGHPQGPPVLAQLPQQPAQNPAWLILHPLWWGHTEHPWQEALLPTTTLTPGRSASLPPHKTTAQSGGDSQPWQSHGPPRLAALSLRDASFPLPDTPRLSWQILPPSPPPGFSRSHNSILFMETNCPAGGCT